MNDDGKHSIENHCSEAFLLWICSLECVQIECTQRELPRQLEDLNDGFFLSTVLASIDNSFPKGCSLETLFHAIKTWCSKQSPDIYMTIKFDVHRICGLVLAVVMISQDNELITKIAQMALSHRSCLVYMTLCVMPLAQDLRNEFEEDPSLIQLNHLTFNCTRMDCQLDKLKYGLRIIEQQIDDLRQEIGYMKNNLETGYFV